MSPTMVQYKTKAFRKWSVMFEQQPNLANDLITKIYYIALHTISPFGDKLKRSLAPRIVTKIQLYCTA